MKPTFDSQPYRKTSENRLFFQSCQPEFSVDGESVTMQLCPIFLKRYTCITKA